MGQAEFIAAHRHYQRLLRRGVRESVGSSGWSHKHVSTTHNEESIYASMSTRGMGYTRKRIHAHTHTHRLLLPQRRWSPSCTLWCPRPASGPQRIHHVSSSAPHPITQRDEIDLVLRVMQLLFPGVSSAHGLLTSSSPCPRPDDPRGFTMAIAVCGVFVGDAAQAACAVDLTQRLCAGCDDTSRTRCVRKRVLCVGPRRKRKRQVL